MPDDKPVYTVRKWNGNIQPDFSNNDDWSDVLPAQIGHFRPESSDHRPETILKLQHSGTMLFGLFTVRDRYIRSVHKGFGVPVCKDSCVEFFIQPGNTNGYFNFEFNCGGSVLCYYITDHKRTKDGFAEYTRLSESDYSELNIYHTLPFIIEPAINKEVSWDLGFSIPISLLEKFTYPLGEFSGKEWSGNFYKCGDETSHPHWAAWSPVSELNFHLPKCFGRILFEE